MDINYDEILYGAGMYKYGIVDSKSVKYYDDVRKMCEVNTCGHYNKTWACPPAVGTIDECRERCHSYDKMLVFCSKYTLEDAYDYEAMMDAMHDFKQKTRALEDALKPYYDKYLMLSNEGCDLCEECTYPDAPCRHPGRAHGSIEGYGIFVSELAKSAGMEYNNGENTITYFAAVLFNDQG